MREYNKILIKNGMYCNKWVIVIVILKQNDYYLENKFW